MLVDVEQLLAHQRHILGLQLLLLRREEVVLLGQQLHRVLHAQAELLIYQVVALLHVAQPLAGREVLRLRRGGIEVDALDGLQQLLLRVEQLQLAGGQRVLRLVVGRLVLTVAEDGNAQRQADAL